MPIVSSFAVVSMRESRFFVRRVRSHVNEMRQLPLPSVFSYLIRGLKRRLHISGALDENQGSSEMLGLPFAEAALRRVKQKAYLAYVSYQPRFYRGKINFVTAEIKSFFPGDPATVWADLATELQVGRCVSLTRSGPQFSVAAREHELQLRDGPPKLRRPQRRPDRSRRSRVHQAR